MSNKTPYTVINGYRFVPIDAPQLPELRASLYALASKLDLHGTILLAPEGVNVALCGKNEAVDALIEAFEAYEPLAGMTFKIMPHDTFIFRRLVVKVKPQIIVFEDNALDPTQEGNKRIMPKQLKTWLDEGKDFVLLDTRNQFEVAFGTFDQAKTLPVRRFRGFCRALEASDIDKNVPVVTFCTGGVRCEKVVPYMRKQGYQNGYQLEGGIFNYFKEVGNAHWQGECFVFDYRTALDANLRATGTVQCRVCYGPVSLEAQEDNRYEAGVSCPVCFQAEAESA